MQVVHSKFQDLVPKRIELDDPELQRPDEDKIKEVTDCILSVTQCNSNLCL